MDAKVVFSAAGKTPRLERWLAIHRRSFIRYQRRYGYRLGETSLEILDIRHWEARICGLDPSDPMIWAWWRRWHWFNRWEFCRQCRYARRYGQTITWPKGMNPTIAPTVTTESEPLNFYKGEIPPIG